MSLEKILERIRLEGEQESAEIVRQAQEEARAIREQAAQEAAAIYQAACREAQHFTEGECARLLNEARFEARCLAGAARERFVDAVLAGVQARLTRARGSPSYTQVMRKLLREVLPAENGQGPAGEHVFLEADPRDRALITALLSEWGRDDIEVRYSLDCLGGLNACSVNRGTRVVNTLESRLERALPYLRRELAGRFEELASSSVESPPPQREGALPHGEGHRA